MSLSVTPECPDQPDILDLLAASDAFSASLYPPESNHMVGLEALLCPGVMFLVARFAGRAVGCGALVGTGATTAELKRMFVSDGVRGRGVGRALLNALEDQAQIRCVRLIQLETGIASQGALALYRAAGYVERGPFGPYRSDPLSIFMEKHLPARP